MSSGWSCTLRGFRANPRHARRVGEGTTVFSSLSTYLASLHRLLSLSPTIIYPAHGPVLPDGQGAIRTYISHRQARERQIVEVLSRPRTIQDDQHVPGEWETGERIGYSTEDITSIVYPDVSVVIKVAAARGGRSRGCLALTLGLTR